MSERRIDRDPSSSAMGNPQQGPAAYDRPAADAVGRVSDGSGASMELDPAELKSEVGGAALERRVADLSRSPKDVPREVEVVMGESRVGEGAADRPDAEDRLPEKIAASNGVRAPNRVVRNWMNGFEVGDMVWGKVKSHPWWPGYIFNEAFASPSVRRTKREGHVLVAFFGDSSYGWLEPAELILFGPHYAEMSKQTTLRSFVMAVEEAVDEASRREALALTCYCRHECNFRPARVPKYFYVDVAGFEPGVIYSSKQINRAKEKFVPDKALSFVQQVALDPLTIDLTGLDQIKRMAMLLAYRRATFEEFDETYAQAFGVQPVRPPPLTRAMLDQPERFDPRAPPLNGPLVVSEALPNRKSSSDELCVIAAKVSPTNNKYALKQRDEQESSTSASSPLNQRPDRSPLPAQPSHNNYNITQPQPQQQQTTGPCVPQIHPTSIFQDASSASAPAPCGSNFAADKKPLQNFQDSRASPREDGRVSQQKTVPVAVDTPPIVVSPPQTSDDSTSKTELPPQLTLGRTWKIGPGTVDSPISPASHVDVDANYGFGLQFSARAAEDSKKERMKKRLREDGSSGDVKRKKNELEIGNHVKVPTNEYPHSKSAGKAIISIGRELLEREDGVYPSAFAVQLPRIDPSPGSLELPEMVGDLHELALEPFYGIDRGAPSVFLKFRSLVYQKSLALPLMSETNTLEVQAGSSSAARTPQEPVAGSAEIGSSKTAPSTSRPPRASSRPDDPTVVGRKRSPSHRQEEMSGKRQKKLKKLKALAAEKKGKRSSMTAASAPAGPAKPNGKAAAAEPVKKPEPPSDPPPSPSPTALVMKFPPRNTLPSVASLKARFARFGALELSGTRVLWKSNTCKVVYKFKPDAEAALDSVKSNEVFGQIKVQYHLRDADPPAPEPSSDAGGQRPESRPAEGLQLRPGGGASSSGSISFGQSRPLSIENQKPTGQLKSILKKPCDEAGPSGGVVREAPRVKFLLGGGGDPKAETPLVAGGSNNNVRSNADALSSSLLTIEPVVTKTTLKSTSFLPPPPPPPSRPLQLYPSKPIDNHHLPPPPPVPSIPSVSLPPPPLPLRVADKVLLPPPPHRNSDKAARSRDLQLHSCRQYGEAEGRGKASVVFAKQMLSLLVRCSDIVTGVKSSVGNALYQRL